MQTFPQGQHGSPDSGKEGGQIGGDLGLSPGERLAVMGSDREVRESAQWKMRDLVGVEGIYDTD